MVGDAQAEPGSGSTSGRAEPWAGSLKRVDLGEIPYEEAIEAMRDHRPRLLSFGVTKNGGLLCDAIVVFSPEVVPALAIQLRRAGQVWSKMRFAAAQLLAYVEDGLWLRNARRANEIAARIAAGLDAPAVAALLAPVEANELFLRLPVPVMDGLERDGIRFFRRPGDIARFVCRFDATHAEADALLASLRRHLAAAG